MMEREWLALHVPNVWESVTKVQRVVADFLTTRPQVLGEAAQMAAAELLENALKYGSDAGGATPSFNLRIEDGTLRIEVANQLRNEADADDVLKTIATIRSSNDLAELYVARTQALLEQGATARSGSGLGLIRIAYEGGFTLSAYVDDQALHIIATRFLP